MIVLSSLAHLCYLYEYSPVIITRRLAREKSIEMLQFSVMKHNDSLAMHRHYDTYTQAQGDISMHWQTYLATLLSDRESVYFLLYITVCAVAIARPPWYCLLLLDIIKQSENLINILRAITMSYWQLILTMLLGIISVFIFASVAFSSFDSYDFYVSDGDAQAVTYCSDLWNCFFSTLNIGVRSGGGIGDGIRSPLLDEKYGSRVIFDLFFFIVVIIILLNIIFGIILDNFSQLRSKRNEQKLAMNSQCYICNAERNKLQLQGRGWSFHFMFEHSPFAYLSFLVYIQDRSWSDCNGIEYYVKRCLASGSTSFFPTTSKYLSTESSHS
jgi:hypothetical protein